MKKLLFLFILLAFTFLSVNAQTPWYLTGNAGTNPSSNFIGTTDNAPLVFKTRGTEQMRLSKDGPYLGIGVVDPLATLHLHNPQINGQLPLLRLTTQNSRTGFSIFSNLFTNDILFQQQEDAKFFIKGLGGGLAITPAGKIGIGTDEPEQLVHVVGKMLIESTESTTGGLQFKYSDGQGGIHLNPNYWDIYSDNNGLKFYSVFDTGAKTQRMVINRNGNLGIGVTNPSAKLHVDQDIIAEGNITTKSNLVLAPDTNNSNSKNIWEISRTNTGLNYTYTLRVPQNILFLGNDGKIGVGLTNPSAELDVNGMLHATSASIIGGLTASFIKASLKTTTDIFEANSATIDGATTTNTLTANSAEINGALTANSAEIDGTTTTDILAANSANINGLVKAKEIKVTLAGWPDYVFSKEHKLLPLNEIAQFITENQHLPNVPSAAEVEENGIELGAMNAILLQKVEELTLYVLDLQKQIDELKNR